MKLERYIIVNHIDFNTYYIGSPIQIEKGNIILDSLDNSLLLQLKIINVSKKNLKAVYLTADYYNASNELIMSGIRVNYLGLSCSYREVCGTDMLVKIIDNDVFNVKLHIKKIVFEDLSIAESDYTEIQIPKLKRISNEWGESEQYEAHRLVNEKMNYIPLELGNNVWICSCGYVNENQHCIGCDAEKKVIFETINRDVLHKAVEETSHRQAEIEKHRQEEIERKEKEAIVKRNKQVKILQTMTKIGVPLVIVIIILIITIPKVIDYNNKQNVISMFESGNYNAAFTATEDLWGNNVPDKIAECQESAVAAMFEAGDYKKAINKSKELWKNNVPNKIAECQKEAVISMFKSDDYVTAIAETESIWGDSLPKDIETYREYALSDLREETTQYRGKISANIGYTVGILANGSVVAVGSNSSSSGECEVSDWSGVKEVSGSFYTLGLKSNGTVLTATGYFDDEHGEYNVSEWSNIISVDGGGMHTVGLKSNGSVIATGANYWGECNVSAWTDIVEISAGDFHTVGLRADGTVIAVGDNDKGQCDVSTWTDIVEISAGCDYTVGLRADGTVVATGSNEYNRCNVSDWMNIIEISACYSCTVGLKYDGTVVVAGNNEKIQDNASNWKNIVAISAGNMHIIGVKSDGSVVAVGYNTNAEACDVYNWDLW